MKLFSFGRCTVGVILLLLGTYALAGQSSSTYRLIKKIPFAAANGGHEYYDYLTFDASTRRLYLSHGTEVIVVNADSGTVVGNIGDMKQNHGIALAKEFGKGFITDGGDHSVVIFDLKTLKVTGKVKTDDGPDGIIYDPASKHVLAFGHVMTVIDPANGAVLATIPLGGTLEFAVADG